MTAAAVLRLDARSAQDPCLRAEVQRVDGTTVVRLVGDLDVDTAPSLRTGLLEALADGPVVVDLADVPLVDASGLATLVAVDRAGRELGHPLRLRGAAGLCLRVLHVSGLHRVLTLEP